MAIIVLEQRGHEGQDHSEPQQVHQQRDKHNQQCPVIDTSALPCGLVNTLSVSQISLHLQSVLTAASGGQLPNYNISAVQNHRATPTYCIPHPVLHK